jgi:hypothetical protein
MAAQGPSTGNLGQSPLPPPGPTDQGGNNLGAQTTVGTNTTLAPGNPGNQNPARGGTTLPRGQAGHTNPSGATS